MTMTSEVSDLASATATEITDVARDQYDNVVAVIRRNPLQSAGVAAATGFVLALLARGFGKPSVR